MSFMQRVLRMTPISYHEKAKMHRISEERFNNMKDMMYPADWDCRLDRETFRYPEPIVYGIYCTCILIHIKQEKHYFECYSPRDVSPNELVQEAQKLMESEVKVV